MYRRLGNPQIAIVIVCSKWDRMVYNTVLTAEKWGLQIAGVQIAGVYCTYSNFQLGVFIAVVKVASGHFLLVIHTTGNHA